MNTAMRATIAFVLCASCAHGLAAEKQGASRPIVGAIRWDAFYGTGNVVQAVEKSLGPARYHHRAPFFAKVKGEDKLSINGDTDEVMKQEIAYAAEAGVYWAFLTYPWQSELSAPLRRFLQHSDRNQVKFALILSEHVVKEWDRHFRKVLLDACAMPNYQTVLDGRPLIYFFQDVHTKQKLAGVRALVQQRTGKNPYFIFLMHGIPKQKWPEKKALGFDASTKYAQFPHQMRMTYQAFDQQIQRDWQSWAKSKYQHTPLLSAGWDNRPRYYNPVSWIPKKESMLTRYSETPTAQELAAQVKAGMDFVHKNQKFCEARNLLMYAWNEHDEGGWLCPTLDPKTGGMDDRRVKAVGKVIHGWRASDAETVRREKTR